MLIIGLTGSIGMGKTTIARHLEKKGIPVLDADAEVHRLYSGKAAPLIEKAFPGTVVDGTVDRTKLSEALGAEPGRIDKLESIVHPLVRAAEREFLLRQALQGAAMAVLEIPLLFETGGDALVDATVVVSAPAQVQKERVLARPGMSAEKLDRLLANQLPDADKRERADFVVDTSLPLEETLADVDRIVEALRGREGEALNRWRGMA